MTDLQLTIKNLRDNVTRYDKPERYYRGDHDLSFATEKFENAFGSLFREFALNLCPAIVDAVRDKLKVTGFSVGTRTLLSASSPYGDETPISDLQAAIDSIWSSCRLDLAAEEIHLEALKTGDAYAIVWPGENGGVTIYPQRAAACTVIYDEEVPGLMRFAPKYWRTSDCRVHLNLLYRDRIEKYVSRAK